MSFWHLTQHLLFYCNTELRERARGRENQLSTEIALHSPSSLQVCLSLLLSWMSAIRHAQLDSCQMCGLALGLLPMGDWALSCVCTSLCVCGEKANQLSVWKKYTHEQTQNDRCQQTYAYTHTYTQSSRPSLLQAVVCKKHTPISMGLGTAG